MRLTKEDHQKLRARSQTKAAFAATHGWAVGEIAAAAHDITVGMFQSGVIVTEGTLLRVIGPSGNGLHPIAVAKADADHYAFAVSAANLRQPNDQAISDGAKKRL